MVPNTKEGKRALTNYRVLDKVGRKAAWVAFEPLTGRTHQIRVHAAEALETPILGDGKYGGREAFIDGEGIAQGGGGGVSAFARGEDPVEVRIVLDDDAIVVTFGEVARVR